MQPAARESGAWSYEVALARDGRLQVRATFPPGAVDAVTDLSVTEAAEPYVRDLKSSTGALTAHGTSWRTSSCTNGCTIEYSFALAEATRNIRRDEIASGVYDAWQAPPSAWLLRPMMVRDSDRFDLLVRTPADYTFASGLEPAATNDGTKRFRGPAAMLGRTPYALFGKLRTRAVQTSGVTLTLALDTNARQANDDAFVAWVERSAHVVSKTFGRFPMDHALVGVLPGRGSRVGFGRAMAGPVGGSILVDIGAAATERTLREDWVLVHEMIHLAFPSLDRRHRWMEEGLATYLEPIARARFGLVSEEDVWGDFARMMANGLPEEGDRGLDRTPTWGRVYWGGALFCFVADVEIRKRTKGQKSLDDALRAVLDAGGNNGSVWPIERVFQKGDQALGVRVLEPLYEGWKETPVDVDLKSLFRDLGVRASGETVRFDDSAPLASVRKSMTAEQQARR